MSDFGSAAEKVQRLKHNIKNETERSLSDSMEDVESSMRHHLANGNSVATGTLINGLRTIEGPDADPIAYTSQHIVGPEYWRYLEFGTGIYSSRAYKAPDHAAPVDPILEWVLAKGIMPDPSQPADDQYQLAHAIANSISRGTEQHQFARPAWRGLHGKRHVIDSVSDGIDRAIKWTF